jgi:hypothetical protein
MGADGADGVEWRRRASGVAQQAPRIDVESEAGRSVAKEV